MGMFDTVVIKDLKLKAPKEIVKLLKDNNKAFPSEFQTKDLDNVLATYFIRESGQVYVEQRKSTGKKIPYTNPFQGWEDSRSLLEKLYWKIKFKDTSYSLSNRLVEEVKLVKVKSDLTQTFEIYSLEEVGNRYIDLSYTLKAVNGRITSCKLNKWSIESEKDAKKRHKNDDEFKQKMETSFAKRKEFQSKWYYPILKQTYNPFIFFTRLFVHYLCNKITTSSYRWKGV